MKILKAHVENFGSYKELDFVFDAQGLSLISGPTGSGKSTLCDVIPWILFGRTAKDGAVDEVINWNANSPTTGTLQLDVRSSSLSITRVRGKGSNDLYFSVDGIISRGKDLLDTQKIINEKLGLTADLYLLGAYFHEFSQAAAFFTTTAKLRRQLTEQLVDLSFPKSLADDLGNYKKQIKKEVEELASTAASLKKQGDYIATQRIGIKHDQEGWDHNKAKKILDLRKLHASFEEDKAKEIEALIQKTEDEILRLSKDLEENERAYKQPTYYSDQITVLKAKLAIAEIDKCPECGSPKDTASAMVLLKRINALEQQGYENAHRKTAVALLSKQIGRNIDKRRDGIEAISTRVNTHLATLEYVRNQRNPYDDTLVEFNRKLAALGEEKAQAEKDLETFNIELADVNMLISAVEALRSVMIKDSITFLETRTNDLLMRHFDSELRVKFELADADKLEVVIFKDENQCVYTQLSKGQRQLLKLCYGVSVMKAISNHHGISFSAIFLDEPSDGLSEELKIKTYNLLQELALEHSSVFCVEHFSELKAMFTKEFKVTLANSASSISEV